MIKQKQPTTIYFSCPKCNTKYSAQPDQTGKQGKCKSCGARIVVPSLQQSNHHRDSSGRNRFYTTFALCLIFGWAGIHRFYVRKIGTGILQLITLGGYGIWWLIDLIYLLGGKFKDNQQSTLVNPKPKATIAISSCFILIVFIVLISGKKQTYRNSGIWGLGKDIKKMFYQDVDHYYQEKWEVFSGKQLSGKFGYYLEKYGKIHCKFSWANKGLAPVPSGYAGGEIYFYLNLLILPNGKGEAALSMKGSTFGPTTGYKVYDEGDKAPLKWKISTNYLTVDFPQLRGLVNSDYDDHQARPYIESLLKTNLRETDRKQFWFFSKHWREPQYIVFDIIRFLLLCCHKICSVADKIKATLRLAEKRSALILFLTSHAVRQHKRRKKSQETFSWAYYM